MTSRERQSSLIGALAPNFRIQELNAHKMLQSLLALDDNRQEFKQKYEAEWLRRMYGFEPRKLKEEFSADSVQQSGVQSTSGMRESPPRSHRGPKI